MEWKRGYCRWGGYEAAAIADETGVVIFYEVGKKGQGAVFLIPTVDCRQRVLDDRAAALRAELVVVIVHLLDLKAYAGEKDPILDAVLNYALPLAYEAVVRNIEEDEDGNEGD